MNQEIQRASGIPIAEMCEEQELSGLKIFHDGWWHMM